MADTVDSPVAPGVSTDDSPKRQARARELTYAELRERWRQSSERERMMLLAKRTPIVWVLFSGVMFLVFALVDNIGTPLSTLALLSVGFAGALTAWVYGALYTVRRYVFREALRAELARAELEDADEKISTSGVVAPDFAVLWEATQARLDYYHELATRQSRTSFRNGQLAAATGLVLIAVCAVLAISARTTAATIAASLLGVAGGGLAGYIGATFMKAQEFSAQQLREYFTQPVAFSRFLAAERLLDRLPEENRSEAVTAIIQGMMVSQSPPSKD